MGHELRRLPSEVKVREQYEQALLELERFTVEAACPDARVHGVVQAQLAEKFGKCLPKFFEPFPRLPAGFAIESENSAFVLERTVGKETAYSVRVMADNRSDQTKVCIEMHEDLHQLVEKLGYALEIDGGAYKVGQMQLIAYDLLMLSNRVS